MSYYQKKLGQVLNLSTNHHFYELPILYLNSKAENDCDFLLLFSNQDGLNLVTTKNEQGYSQSFKQASRWTRDKLLEGLTSVPLADLTTCQFLALPRELPNNLATILHLYPDLESLAAVKQQHQLSLAQARESLYDPFRSATESQNQDEQLPSYRISQTDKRYEDELEVFDLVSRGKTKGQVKDISLKYRDDEKGIETTIFVRGWYLFDGKPPLQISWRPTHTRNAYWRSSHVYVDKKTGHYFFRGELYQRRKQTPIFLKNLSFTSAPSKMLKERWAIFEGIIQEQKDIYLAHTSNSTIKVR